ncbi:50S ribosomal protein L32 [Buchnera aphidicola]|uniref:Large ribosomal subunit protein bL32 n=1 Tax=Buchnera aphidicola (Sarucallis kahawaluokalani) TaxID=1241878 RepID=A0A4D6Y9G8_9GAMM|nr:50S ribosomal protein L32 [Buchnera aphidicola]QCI26029.1 50S ribosomal protein L32 [Buchnera aphidicola (Sarucallis kahawaluokalani)]
MAVQKSKPTRSKRGMRRSHSKLTPVILSQDKFSKEIHIRHCITKKLFYKGQLIIKKNHNK